MQCLWACQKRRTLALSRVRLCPCLDVNDVGLLHKPSRHCLSLTKPKHSRILRFQRTAGLVKLRRDIEAVVEGRLRAESS
jgi:hypothetical protein